MSDLSQISDDELKKLAGISDISDSELMNIAGLKSKSPHPETILQRAAKIARQVAGPHLQAVGGAIDTAAFGLPGTAMDKFAPQSAKDFIKPQGFGEEVGRAVGNIAGFIGGGPEQLAGKGALKLAPKAGRFAKGAIKTGAATASMSPGNIAQGSSIGKEGLKVGGGALLGGALESIPNMFMKASFRKNIKREKLESLFKDIGGIKSQVKSSGQTYDATKLLGELERISDDMAPAVRGKATELNRWIKDIKSRTQSTILNTKGKPVSKPPIISADELRQMEAELGSFAKFGSQKNGFMQFVKPQSPVANESTKQARTVASSEYDKIAGTEFAEKSKKASSILKRYPDLDPSKGRNDFGQRVAGSIAAASATGNPLIGFGAYIAQKLAGLPEVKQGAYKALTNPLSKAVGRGAKSSIRASYGSQ